MADLYGGRKPLFEDEGLQEEEVWSLVKAREDSNPKTRKNHFSGSSSSNTWRSAVPHAIRRASGGGSSTAWTEPQQSSAPVDIPDWSKILKRKSNKNLWDDASGAHNNDDDGDYMGWKNRHGLVVDEESYDDDEDGNEMVPPHEYLARRLASTQIASFSMCEGVGRTLKGRDLSKLRNAILTKTGFLE